MRWRTANNRRKPRWVVHPLSGDYALFARGRGFISWPFNIKSSSDL